MPVIIVAIVQFIAMVVLRIVIGVVTYLTSGKLAAHIIEKFPRVNASVVFFSLNLTIASILTVMAAPLFAIIASMC